MRKASEASGAERSAFDRRIDPRTLSTGTSGSVAEVEAVCRRIAEYLIEVSRDPRLEPALHEFTRTLDRRRRELDAATRARAEQLADTMFRYEMSGHDRGAVRERCDPYFWG